MAKKQARVKPGQPLMSDYQRSHAPVAPEGTVGWGLTRYIYVQCPRLDGDERWLLPIPPGVRHPAPALNSSDPNARGSPEHDVDGYAWAGMLADWCQLNVFPASLRKTVGGMATCSRSQLQGLGIWDSYSRKHVGHRPRVRRPWPVLGVINDLTRRFQSIHPQDDGALYDTATSPECIFSGRMLWMDLLTAKRTSEFEQAPLSFQLRLKCDIEYAARALDATQPEYWREREQKKYEDEYFTTRLFVSIAGQNGSATSAVCHVIHRTRNGDGGWSVKLVHQFVGAEKAYMCMFFDETGKAIPTFVNCSIRLGLVRREKIHGSSLPARPFLESLDYEKTPTIWLYTRFVVCKARPRLNERDAGRVQDVVELTKERATRAIEALQDIPLALEHPPVDDIPILQEHLPYEHLPDELVVFDNDGITSMISGDKLSVDDCPKPEESARSTPSTRYRRVLPDLKKYDEAFKSRLRMPAVASLVMHTDRLLGVGHHSMVHDALLKLPAPLTTSDGGGFVRVAAKTAFQDPERKSAREMFENEALVHAAMPRHLQDDYTGLVKTPPIREQVPVQAVVPKFYGYYVPVEEEAKTDPGVGPANTRSGIILLEYCGVPIEPDRLNGDDIREVYSLLLRMHQQDVLQGSFAARNFLVQPGPLHLPPSSRSLDTPSFRIVDFGRGQHYSDYIETQAKEGEMNAQEIKEEYMRMKYYGQQNALAELGLLDRDGCVDYDKVCPVGIPKPKHRDLDSWMGLWI